MGTRITDSGGTDWLLQLSRMRKGSKEIIEKALKAGADILADGFRSEIETIPTDDRHLPEGQMRQGIRTLQKQGLLGSFGISPVDSKDGVYDVHLGWEGYNSIVTDRWPKGQPNRMVARSVNAGASYMTAYPFIDRARNKYRKDAEKAMEETVAEEIGKITE